MAYLLEVYCLLRYEASDDLRDGILNNWLVNVTGEVGKWIEGDLLQEHYNRWLEDMIKKRGGDFDDKFYRQTLPPNVEHFLRIKEEIEDAFDLKIRGKTHTSPHLRDELRLLLALYREENVHLFCTGRTMGHAAVNQFDEGYNKLRNGKLKDFIDKTTTYGDITADIQTYKKFQDRSTPSPDFEDEELIQHNASHGDPPHDSEFSLASSESYRDFELKSDSDSGASSSQSQSQLEDGLDEVDPSNDHLVSGSSYSMRISDGRLIHENWYEENEDYNSSDEELEDGTHRDWHELEFNGNLPMLSEDEDGEVIGLYNSDYASE